MSVTDLTSTTWKIYREPVCSIGEFNLGDTYNHTFNINFISNNNNYTSFRLYRHWYEEEYSDDIYDDETGEVINTDTYTEERDEHYIYYNTVRVHEQTEATDDWSDDAHDEEIDDYISPYQTIEITGGTDASNSDLETWLLANAELVTPEPEPEPEPEGITDLTGYTWVGNSSLSNIAPSGTDITSKDGMAENYAINFTCNNVSYTYFNVLDRDYSPYGYFYSNEALNSDDGTTVVYTESWISDNFKTIQIIGGTDATNSNLIAWLQNNGTLTQSAPVTPPLRMYYGNKAIEKIVIRQNDTNLEVASTSCDVPVSFADASWSQIKQICKSGKAKSNWNIGDIKTITDTNGDTYHVEIINIEPAPYGRYKYVSDNSPVTVVFQFVELYKTKYRINSSKVAYKTTEINTTTLPNILSTFTELNSVLEPIVIDCIENTSSSSSNVEGVECKLFLPAQQEIAPLDYSPGYKNYIYEANSTYANSYWGPFNKYNGAGGSEILKKKIYNSDNYGEYWLRTPVYAHTAYQSIGEAGGTVGARNPSTSEYLSICFAL